MDEQLYYLICSQTNFSVCTADDLGPMVVRYDLTRLHIGVLHRRSYHMERHYQYVATFRSSMTRVNGYRVYPQHDLTLTVRTVPAHETQET